MLRRKFEIENSPESLRKLFRINEECGFAEAIVKAIEEDASLSDRKESDGTVVPMFFINTEVDSKPEEDSACISIYIVAHKTAEEPLKNFSNWLISNYEAKEIKSEGSD